MGADNTHMHKVLDVRVEWREFGNQLCGQPKPGKEDANEYHRHYGHRVSWLYIISKEETEAKNLESKGFRDFLFFQPLHYHVYPASGHNNLVGIGL